MLYVDTVDLLSLMLYVDNVDLLSLMLYVVTVDLLSLMLYVDTVDSITPNKVRDVRTFLNGSAMDVMYYTSPLYRTEVFHFTILCFLPLLSFNE